MASQAGIEPAAHSLEGCCSNPTELLGHISLTRLQLVRLDIQGKPNGFPMTLVLTDSLYLSLNFKRDP